MTLIRKFYAKYKLVFFAVPVTALILGSVQMITDPPLLLLERFVPGSGWIEVTLACVYAAIVINGMKDPNKVEQWRKITWLIFSVVFFSQLLLGLVVDARFLMTGKLHLPVPAIVIGGPLYRMQLSIMPLLFISTVVLTGPAWCSHLCYFGAFDNLAASGKGMRNRPIKNKMAIKNVFIFLLITVALLFNLFGVNSFIATASGIFAGVAGVVILLVFSWKNKIMIHCTVYCPLGTLVNYIKHVSPFRMHITEACTECMACTLKCKYDALNLKDIRARKPGITCTYCGDCIPACSREAIIYRFWSMPPQTARNLYLVLTISLHASFLFLARI
ncbi:MAG: 4Fe-4S binding protein [Bacteroidales bacterium]|nr:4Fe-4S binding protein [Bacteroidales bacterium]